MKKTFKNGCEKSCGPTETVPDLLLRVAPYESIEKAYELDQTAK
jgi:hypothetical protein